MAAQLRLKLSNDDLAVLEAVVRGNEEFVAAVDTSSRLPSEDPLDFMRFVRSWRESDAH
jgi:hypothetical protein